ncbi:MAG: general secretion pathway protein GspK [Verrucomicrobiae bacterium]|nr:general secretion pathway protein GspK [Verrucomicrobiae bacterium]
MLLVVFAVLFLSFIVVGLWEVSQFSWDESSLERGRFQAKMLAESGAALAMHPNVKVGDPVLRQEFPDGRKIEVRVGTEGGRLLVTQLDGELFINATRELFIRWGLDAASASIASESLADWIDDNDRARTNGAETDFYATLKHPEFPGNEDFSSLEQMLLVRGMDKVARIKPDWRDYFTLYGDGTIDVNEAPADLLEAFFGTTPDAAASVIATRNGDDGLEGTEDDYRFRGLQEVQVLLGVSSDQWEEVQDFVSLENSTKRIESIGSVGDEYVYRLITLAEGADDNGQGGTTVARITE